MTNSKLAFDPIERAGELWQEHFGDASSMRLATSVMRVQQVMLAALDGALKPFGLTFARYEVLVLLTFSRTGPLALSKIGERLMVHPASVTNAIDRLQARGLVSRVPDATDRRRTFAALTAEGEQVVLEATKALTAIDFAVQGLAADEQDQTFEVLKKLRMAAGDFSSL